MFRVLAGFGAAFLAGSVASSAHAQRRPTAPPLLFAERAQGFGMQQPCADTQEGCYSHYVVSFDLDRDGDLDIVFASGGGYYEPAQAELMAKAHAGSARARARAPRASATWMATAISTWSSRIGAARRPRARGRPKSI